MTLVWTVTSVIVGFQIAAFIFRLERETHFTPEDRHFPVAEYLNLGSIVVLVGGVLIMPLVWKAPVSIVKGCLQPR